jgi:hypothetical protein
VKDEWSLNLSLSLLVTGNTIGMDWFVTWGRNNEIDQVTSSNLLSLTPFVSAHKERIDKMPKIFLVRFSDVDCTVGI